VQQTRAVAGLNPVFEEDFMAKLSKDHKQVTCSVYQSQPGEARELLGNCRVNLTDIEFAPGSFMEVAVMSLQDTPTPIMANGLESTLKIFLARSNGRKSARAPEDLPAIDPADIKRLEDEINTTRVHTEKLDTQLASAKQDTKQARDLEVKLLQMQQNLDQMQQKLDQSETARYTLTGDVQRLQETGVKQLEDMRVQLALQSQEELAQKEKNLKEIEIELQQNDLHTKTIEAAKRDLQVELEQLQGALHVKEQVQIELQRELVDARAATEGLLRKSKEQLVVKSTSAACSQCTGKSALLHEVGTQLELMAKQLMAVEHEKRDAESRAVISLDQLTLLQEENRTLKGEIKKLMDELQKLTKALLSERDDFKALKLRLNAVPDPENENAKLMRMNTRLKQEVDLACVAIEEARKGEAESARLKAEMSKLKYVLQQKDTELQQLRANAVSPDMDEPIFAKKERSTALRAAPSRSAAPPPTLPVQLAVAATASAASPRVDTHTHTHAHTHTHTQPNGRIGLKIADVPPHQVLSVTELMDKDGIVINHKVEINDELVEIDGVHVESMPGVLQNVAGPAGTLVCMNFKRHETGEYYDIVAIRHTMQAAQGLGGGSTCRHTLLLNAHTCSNCRPIRNSQQTRTYITKHTRTHSSCSMAVGRVWRRTLRFLQFSVLAQAMPVVLQHSTNALSTSDVCVVLILA